MIEKTNGKYVHIFFQVTGHIQYTEGFVKFSGATPLKNITLKKLYDVCRPFLNGMTERNFEKILNAMVGDGILTTFKEKKKKELFYALSPKAIEIIKFHKEIIERAISAREEEAKKTILECKELRDSLNKVKG